MSDADACLGTDFLNEIRERINRFNSIVNHVHLAASFKNEKAQVLAETLDQAIAKKALDESQLANAKRDLERYTQLSANVIAAKTVDTQRALVTQLEAQIKSDEAAIENARAVLSYASVVAPIIRTSPRARTDLKTLAASDGAPSADPAPTMVCASSTNRMRFGRSLISRITF